MRKRVNSHKWLIATEVISCPHCGSKDVYIHNPIQHDRSSDKQDHKYLLLDVQLRCRNCQENVLLYIQIPLKNLIIERVKLEELIENNTG